MKSFNENLPRVRIVFAIAIAIVCVGAFYFGIKRDTTPVSAGQEETYWTFMAGRLEEMLTSSNAISSAHVDFSVDNHAVNKVYLSLTCAEILSPETEDIIKERVADAMNMSMNDISISY